MMPETMYLVREVRKEMNQGSLDVVVEYSDYRRINGVALPHRIEKKIGNDIIAVYAVRYSQNQYADGGFYF
jgi:hypothetical protein